MNNKAFKTLIDFLERVPSIEKPISSGDENEFWWIKFSIDINHSLAWHVIQELGFVVNYISIDEKLLSAFYPVSPPPYLNGGPDEFLSWIIETKDPNFRPGTLKKWLETKLPSPVDDLEMWSDE